MWTWLLPKYLKCFVLCNSLFSLTFFDGINCSWNFPFIDKKKGYFTHILNGIITSSELMKSGLTYCNSFLTSLVSTIAHLQHILHREAREISYIANLTYATSLLKKPYLVSH